MYFRTYEKNIFIQAASDKSIGDRDAVNKTTALITDVQCGNFFFINTELTLQQYTTAREIIIGTKSGEDDTIKFISIHAGVLQCFFCSACAKDGGWFFMASGVTAFFDAGAFLYPFICGVHVAGEIVISDDVFGDVKADAFDVC